jgi:imidazolonepropionase-like amidohydrolase
VVGHGYNVEMATKSVTLGYAGVEHSGWENRFYDDVLQMLALAGTRWDPTLGHPLGLEVLVRDEPERLAETKYRAMTPARLIRTTQTFRFLKVAGDHALHGIWAQQLAAVRAAHHRGVRLQAGSHVPGPYPVVSLHWELEHFVQAGIPPLDVLRIATQDAAAAVGAEDHLGTLEVGKLADIVLLNANPLDDIKNTQTIWRVIKGGWVFDPEKLRPERN